LEEILSTGVITPITTHDCPNVVLQNTLVFGHIFSGGRKNVRGSQFLVSSQNDPLLKKVKEGDVWILKPSRHSLQ